MICCYGKSSHEGEKDNIPCSQAVLFNLLHVQRAVLQRKTITRSKIEVNLKMAAVFPFPSSSLRHSTTGPSAENMKYLSLSIARGRSPVQDGLSAAVQVVELLLGHRVVYVHGGHAQFPGFGQLIQPGGRTAGGRSADFVWVHVVIGQGLACERQ